MERYLLELTRPSRAFRLPSRSNLKRLSRFEMMHLEYSNAEVQILADCLMQGKALEYGLGCVWLPD